MRATSGFVPAVCAAASTGAHVLAFAAFVHSPGSPVAEPAAAAAPWLVDVSAAPDEPAPEPAETPASASRATFVVAPRRAQRPSFVPTRPPEVAPIAPPGPAAPRFVLAVTNRRPETTVVEGRPTSAAAIPGTEADAVPESRVSVPARPATPVTPRYPVGARAEQIEADVAVAIVVAASGEVVDARILRPAGYGFDEAALNALRAARFTPAERDGRPVAVRMRWSVAFRLR